MTVRVRVLLLMLAAILAATWFFRSYEPFERTEFTGYEGEARFNRFFGAELLMNEAGFDADSVDAFEPSDWLPSVDDTLVLRLSPRYEQLVPAQVLTGWAAGGGHLVLFPADVETAASGSLLASLGLALDDSEPLEAGETPGVDDAATYDLSVDGLYRRVVLLDDAADAATTSDFAGVLAARVQHGSGYVTVVISERWFLNFAVTQQKNARFVLDVLAGDIEPGKIWFVFEDSTASLLARLWQFTPGAIVALGVLIALWLWAIVPRFGPLAAGSAADRRSINEHIRAAGLFAFRYDGGASLLEAGIDALIEDAERRHPGLKRLEPAEQATRIARITGLPAAEVATALAGLEEITPREFVRHMQLLQTVRKEL